MRNFLPALVALLGLLAASLANATSMGMASLPADGAGGPVTLFFPTFDTARPVQRGSFELLLAPDARPAPALSNGRLIAISHGSGGGPWPQVTLAQALVDAGFTVVLPFHRGDSWLDPSQPGPASWKLRPAEISHAIDRVAADPRFAGLKLDKVGAYGMSAGGHTMLSLAGGAWSPERFRAHCEQHIADDFNACVGLATRLTGGALDGLKQWVAQRVLNWKFGGDAAPQTHDDPRIAAIVAGVPAAADFDLATLTHPRVPLGFITADADRWLLPRLHSDPLRAACQDCELIADLHGAGHGALLAPPPRPEALGALERELIGDPPGFDRAAATLQWVQPTVAFFHRHLLPAD